MHWRCCGDGSYTSSGLEDSNILSLPGSLGGAMETQDRNMKPVGTGGKFKEKQMYLSVTALEQLHLSLRINKPL